MSNSVSDILPTGLDLPREASIGDLTNEAAVIAVLTRKASCPQLRASLSTGTGIVRRLNRTEN